MEVPPGDGLRQGQVPRGNSAADVPFGTVTSEDRSDPCSNGTYYLNEHFDPERQFCLIPISKT